MFGSSFSRQVLPVQRQLSVCAKRRFQTTSFRAGPKQSSGKATEKKQSSKKFSAINIVSFVIGLSTGLYIYHKLNNQLRNGGLGSTMSTLSEKQLLPLTYGTRREQDQAFLEIAMALGTDRVSRVPSELKEHSDTYWSTHRANDDERPAIVVYPKSTEEVSSIMKIAHKFRIPVTPFSGGTSLEGHFTPTHGGICIDLKFMDNIVAIHKSDLDIIVQPAVGWEALNDVLAEQGLFFPPDPGPGAEIGGMIGTSCSGTNAFRYGTMKDYVISLTVVLADGTIIKTRKRPRKSSAGYNLNGIFVGSEGTLGIVTEATLKVVPKPATESVAVVSFGSIGEAAKCVENVIQSGIQVGAVEILDANQMRTVNEAGYTSRVWKELPTLFFKFSGTKNSVHDQVQQAKKIASQHKCNSFEFAKEETEIEELWSARKSALWATIESAPKNYHAWTTDVAVPVSELANIITKTQQDLDENNIQYTIVGHVGDGNFHSIIVYDPETQRKIVEDAVDRMVHRALDVDGTCTGEHGVGLGKMKFLKDEVGEEAIAVMRRLKFALDPLGILNPGKVISIEPYK